MTTYTLKYMDGTVQTVQQSILALVCHTPDPAPASDYTHYNHLTASGLKIVMEVKAVLGTQESGASLSISQSSGALPEQRAAVEVVGSSVPQSSLMWTRESGGVRLDVAIDEGELPLSLTDDTQPPVALKVVVIRP